MQDLTPTRTLFNYSDNHSAEERKKRDSDVSFSFEGKSNEEIIAICGEAVWAEQEQKQKEVWQPRTLSFEKLLLTKLVNKKPNL